MELREVYSNHSIMRCGQSDHYSSAQLLAWRHRAYSDAVRQADQAWEKVDS